VVPPERVPTVARTFVFVEVFVVESEDFFADSEDLVPDLEALVDWEAVPAASPAAG
jgi:hypothetical protein